MSDVIVPPDPITRLTAALAGRYRIEREIGVGGMATVYLAHDVRHDRPVAIKVLRPDLAASVGAERFLSEIKTTAQLQHAYILGLIDSGEVNGTVFYVMPFVEGESLRERLAHEKQLAISDAVRIATDVAGALDYAHRRGVIHRDIKPANILLHEGQPFLSDFGIALAATRAQDGRRLTESGMSLGTPEYMSPEQAMGDRVLDGRTDSYSLGCVLYEMLTGEPPFTGPTAQAVIAKVMTAEPAPLPTLRRSIPSNVAAACMTALNKVPADRFKTSADFAEALNNPRYAAPHVAAQRAVREARGFPYMPRRDAVAIGVIVLLALAAVMAWLRPRVASNSVVARFEIPIPDSLFSPSVALSRDGTRLVWSNQSGYFERRLDSLVIRRVRDATPATPAVRDAAPSGDNVLVSGRGALAIASLSGGLARTLVPSGARGGSWGTDGYVYFAVADQQGQTRAIARVRAEGGAIDTLVKTEGSVLDIVALPDGRGLVVALNRNGTSELSALDLHTRTLHALGTAGSLPQFVAAGYLLFADGTSLMAGPFDVRKLAFTRPPVAVVDIPRGSVNILVARDQQLVRMLATEATGSGVVVQSRSGVVRPLPNIPDTIRFTGFALSPDGTRFAAAGVVPTAAASIRATPPIANLFLYELSSGRLTRLRSDERDQSPAWLPSGRELSFVRVSTDTPTTSTLMRRSWDGSSLPVQILQRHGGGRGAVLGPVAWLPDGRHAIVRISAMGAGGRGALPGDLMRLSLAEPEKLDTVVATEYAESSPAVTRDGQVLAFTSDESGRTEVYVRPLRGGAQHQVSLGGGTQPKWAHSGKELFYVNADTLFAAGIRAGADLGVGETKIVLVARSIGQGYAVLPGDTAFITAAASTTSRLVVVVNFARELERLFAKK
jgi:serine/threonine-protein kinase